LKTRIWEKVKHEAAHYWHGSKLLVSEVRISMRLVSQLLKGKTLTRREKRQVRITTRFVEGADPHPKYFCRVATKNYNGHSTTGPILSIRHSTLHGAFTTSCDQIVP
jgi:hypothetical protein